MRPLRGAIRQLNKSTSTLVSRASNSLTITLHRTSNRHNILKQVISNIFSRILSHNLRHLPVNLSRKHHRLQNRNVIHGPNQRQLTISTRTSIRVTQINLSLVINSNNANRVRHTSTPHISRTLQTLNPLRISRVVRRLNRTHKFLKSTTKRMPRNIQVINHINRNFNRRQSHTNQNLRFVQSINRRITTSNLRAALFKRIISRSNVRIITSITSTRARMRHIKQTQLANLGPTTIQK